LTCSIGIAAYPHDGDDVDSLLTNADAAMYHAKEQGRNNYQFYDQSMNEVALRRLILENKMRVALEREEFELHYQPKVSVETEKTTSFEALIRWHDPESGIVGPDLFIPIAEETGLINPLGDWALREACRQISIWSDAGTAKPISVNLSTHQFRLGNLADRILSIVEESRIDPSLLELEITESTLMQDEKIVIADLERLGAAGIRTSLDDFGTGYSSFAYLKRLPVDTLKIDRCFVTEIEANPDDAALTASIVSMGKALGLTIVAEGVETQGQRDLLAEWGCDEIQGYFYSRPLPVTELEEWLRQEGRNDPV
jgi:EAL domain-containing protein (putative c-di-GMP-specific phosphodiesterase class I)